MFKLPSIFSDHMILQREKPLTIFGTGTPGKSVTVSIAPLHLTAEEIVPPDGNWRITFPPIQAGTDCTLTVQSDHETITFSDVAFGEVWLAGGQSNMELFLSQAKNGAEELNVCADSNVRCYQVPRNTFIDEQYHQDMAAARCRLPLRKHRAHGPQLPILPQKNWQNKQAFLSGSSAAITAALP